MQAIKTTMQVDVCPEEIGVISDVLPAEDLGLREDVLEDLANAVKVSLESQVPGTEEFEVSPVPVSGSEMPPPVPVSGAASSRTSTRGRSSSCGRA